MLKRVKDLLDLEPEHCLEQRDLNRETAMLMFSRCMRASELLFYPERDPSTLSKIIGHLKKGNDAETLLKAPAPLLGSEDEVLEILPLTFKWSNRMLGDEVYKEVNELRKSASTTEGDTIIDIVKRAEKCSDECREAARIIKNALCRHILSGGLTESESEESDSE
jgi:hypothetical protein